MTASCFRVKTGYLMISSERNEIVLWHKLDRGAAQRGCWTSMHLYYPLVVAVLKTPWIRTLETVQRPTSSLHRICQLSKVWLSLVADVTRSVNNSRSRWVAQRFTSSRYLDSEQPGHSSELRWFASQEHMCLQEDPEEVGWRTSWMCFRFRDLPIDFLYDWWVGVTP